MRKYEATSGVSGEPCIHTASPVFKQSLKTPGAYERLQCLTTNDDRNTIAYNAQPF